MRITWPKWLSPKANRKAEPSAITRLQRELEESQARLRKQMEEVKTDLQPPATPPPGTRGNGSSAHGDGPPTIWHVEENEESYVRPDPSPVARGRLGVQRRIERNRFLVLVMVLAVIALIFYKFMS